MQYGTDWLSKKIKRYAKRREIASLLRKKLALAEASKRNSDWEQRYTFVSGVQRSGTNMLMNILEQNLETDVYHESDGRAFDNYMMRDEDLVEELMSKSPFPNFVIKALHEGDRLKGLMGRFKPSKSIWMFRRHGDVVNSNLVLWPGGRNFIEDVVEDRLSARWRGMGMTDETHAMVQEHHHPELNDASALGIFWVYRNQLYFDQGLDRSDDSLLMSYEWLVMNPEEGTRALCTFLGLKPSAAMWELMSSSSIGKDKKPDIEEPVRRLCIDMHERLNKAWKSKMSALGVEV